MNSILTLVAGLLAIQVARAQPSVIPPVMNQRVIAPSTNELQGLQLTLNDRGTNFTLFLPRGWTNSVSSNAILYVHFHGGAWFVIQEHVRRGAKEPLAVFALGEGSTTYRLPFEDTNRFPRVLALVERELRQRGPAHARIAAVDISSFSAGYGAVRELVKSPGHVPMIRRIVLLDSMYAGLEENGAKNRRPLAAQIDVWLPFARAAMRGEKTFVFAHSQVPTAGYASSAECAAALLSALGLNAEAIAPGLTAAARDPDFPLRTRADTNGLHIWSYGGTDAQAHMTHARHMADVWQALDATERSTSAK